MGTYKRGRLNEYDPFNKAEKPPNQPGEYRIINKSSGTQEIKYVGTSVDVGRRIGEHRRGGKIADGDKVAVQIADGRSTAKTRAAHERATIAKHQPTGNKSIGGEGRPPLKQSKTKPAPKVDVFPEAKPKSGLFGGTGGQKKEKAQVYKAKPERAGLFGGPKKEKPAKFKSKPERKSLFGGFKKGK